ncbi:MAG: FecR family protein [Pseudomonadota bacterium]
MTQLLASLSLIALASGAQAQDIGNVAAVNQDMNGTAPGQAPRLLDLGEGVVEDERIQTSSQGSGQLMFVDQTTLTVAADSDITLDKYIFDAAADEGDMALTMTRGAMRFIGGRISKKRRAIVRTPTATIGIRGGLVIIQVAADGSTRVTQLAGESTSVVAYGDIDGDGLDDGPFGDALESFLAGNPVEEGDFVVLSRAGATAQGLPVPEGDDVIIYGGLLSTEELAQIYEAFEGRGDGSTERLPTEEAVERSSEEIAAVNSDVEDGDKRQPVSTSGESPVESRADDAPPQNPLTDVPEVDQKTLSDLTGEDVDPQQDADVEEPVMMVPPVDQPVDPPVDPPVVTGPVAPEGGFVFFPEAGTSAFTQVELGSLIGTLATPPGEVETLAIELPETAAGLAPTQPDTGNSFFAQSLFPGSGFFSSTATGQPGGVEAPAVSFVVFDGDDNVIFSLTEIDEGVDAEPIVAVFGNPTPDQGDVFANNPTLPGTANSARAYRSEPLLSNVDDPQEIPIQILSNGNDGADGGRILFAELLNGPDGPRELGVAAGPLVRRDGNTAIELTPISIGTETINGDLFVFSETERVASITDNAGNAFFGPENDFVILGTPFDGQEFDGGSNTFIFSSGTALTFPDDRSEIDLFTRTATADVIVEDPLPLANDTTSRATPTTPILDSVLPVGFANCSTARSCGGTYALRPEPLVTGGELSTAGQFDFEPGGVDNNSFQTFFALDDGFQSNIQTGNAGSPSQFLLTANESDSAYLSDTVFAAASDQSESVIAGNTGGSRLVLASSEAVGTDALPAFPTAVEPTPKFARWGFWAASFDVVDAQTLQPDTDIVDLGLWVAGVRPDPTDFAAFTGTAGFSGAAIGTMQSTVDRAQSTLVTGSFDLSYNFAQGVGDFTLDMPGAGVNSQMVSVGQTGNVGSPSYGGSLAQTDLQVRVDGVFYSGGGEVVAGTGGALDVINSANNTRTLGIFAGDKAAPGTIGGPVK